MPPGSLGSLALTLALIFVPTAAAARHGGDFDGDGKQDLAIGVPGESTGAATGCGAVHVLYGSASGPTAAGALFLDAATLGSTNDFIGNFGDALAIGDFDGDGFDDLAIGAPGQTVSGNDGAGEVFVLRGSASGLDVAHPQLWNQDRPGILDHAEPIDVHEQDIGERFGEHLAAGDFDGDGRDDLAISVRETIAGQFRTGAVAVLYGTKKGLKAKRNQLWHENKKHVPDRVEDSEVFGQALVAGDFDGDGRDELVIDVDGENQSGQGSSGAILVLRGAKKGLTAKHSRLIDWADVGLAPDETNPAFGDALAVGDFDHDGNDDLAIGAPQGDAGAAKTTGIVKVVMGSASGLDLATLTTWHENLAGLSGSAAASDRFGAALAAGDFDDDGHDDLAVGVPFGAAGAVTHGGHVLVLFGGGAGLVTVNAQLWSQQNLPGSAEDFDAFGYALASGDFDGDGAVDLAVGVPTEVVGMVSNAGALNVILGAAGIGLSAVGAQIWDQDINLSDVAEQDDRFGKVIGG